MSRALGRYELLRPLARGGMGEVYLARRRAAGVEKWLVVKRMRPERAGDARFLDLFMREARLSMSLAHQNIVPVFDFGRIDDQVFLAMERVEGKDLGSSLAKAGQPMSPLLAAFIAAECCQALDYAHNRRGTDGAPLGIVHRDVTPRNVLLSWSGEVKLTDFGIAALAGDERTKTIGTPAYMAPEQARGDSVDARADLYAIGLVVREAITGVRSRPGFDREAIVAAAKIAMLDPWPESFDSPLKAIVDRATAQNPDDRYPDARSMLEALDTFIVGERSGKKSDAPARQLAAWLAEVWKDERDESGPGESIEADHLVSFLDDGALDVRGTGTVRSMAATMADDPGARLAEPDSTAISVAPPPVNAPTEKVPATRSRRRWIGLAAAGVVAIGGVAIAMTVGRDDAQRQPEPRLQSQPPQPEPRLQPQPPQPEPKLQPQPEPKLQPQPEPKPQLQPEPKPPGAAKKNPPHQVTKIGAGSAAPPSVAVKHKVMINSTPWSYWTVDDDPTRHAAMETLQLAVGPHRIHFTGSEHFHADKTIAIDVKDDDNLRVVEKLEQAP